MSSLLHDATAQPELFEQLRAGRIIMANQLPALVARGKCRLAAAITITFRAQRLAIHRLLEERKRSYQFVVFHPPLTASAIPVQYRLMRLTQQADTPSGIDAAGAQHLTGQRIKRGEVGRRQLAWITLCAQPSGSVMQLTGDSSLGLDSLAPVRNLPHRQATAVDGGQARGVSRHVCGLFHQLLRRCSGGGSNRSFSSNATLHQIQYHTWRRNGLSCGGSPCSIFLASTVSLGRPAAS